MEKYVIKNSQSDLFVQTFVSSSEIVQTSLIEEAMVLPSKKQADDLSKKLTRHGGSEHYEIVVL
ncbi:hypothetical protein [Alkalicoccus halolimnae]|uniref:Uncharacterized protein n=1 Tax=Alkalicoccus halolimnae TaxID=1667239 RepID=A0A5C7F2G5_9BACI|nr:hypothetical protein [Alkalicoccus halolimnae]TXF81433.1 hypothetical protein FTX54_15930 [Alkalicoccus halolimnae]